MLQITNGLCCEAVASKQTWRKKAEHLGTTNSSWYQKLIFHIEVGMVKKKKKDVFCQCKKMEQGISCASPSIMKLILRKRVHRKCVRDMVSCVCVGELHLSVRKRGEHMLYYVTHRRRCEIRQWWVTKSKACCAFWVEVFLHVCVWRICILSAAAAAAFWQRLSSSMVGRPLMCQLQYCMCMCVWVCVHMWACPTYTYMHSQVGPQDAS